MTKHAADCDERLIVDRRIQLRYRNVGTERAAHLCRAHRSTTRRAAAVILDQLAQRDAKSALDQARPLEVAGQLDWQCAARLAYAEIPVKLGTLVQHDRHAGERHHVIDYCRFAEQALDRGKRRLEANLAAFAFETLQ